MILFENFHAAFHHKYDVYLIARLLKSKGMKVAVLNIYGEDKQNDFPEIDLIELPFQYKIPDDRAWLECDGSVVRRLFYVLRFLKQQRQYMKEVRQFVEDIADSFYLGSYHLLMPSEFIGMKKPCYYWGLRSYRMTGFWQTFKSNPFLAFRMVRLKKVFLRNDFQKLFVSNEIIKKEFIEIGIPENRLVIREERCIEGEKLFNPENKDNFFSLLIIGGLRRQKHIEATIRAFKKASLDEGVLRIVGENQDDDYEKIIIDEINDSKHIVRINKHLLYDEFNKFMGGAHFTVFADEKQKSSVTNGTMMESIINFTPIIAPDHEPYTFYIEKYGLGLTYKYGDEDSYAEVIKKAQQLGYDYFLDNIKKFQKIISFDTIANQLYSSLKKSDKVN